MSPMYMEPTPTPNNNHVSTRMSELMRAPTHTPARSNCLTILLAMVAVGLSLFAGLYMGAATQLGADFITALDIPSAAKADAPCDNPSISPTPVSTPIWKDEYLADASFQAIPKAPPTPRIFSLPHIPTSTLYKSASLRDLIYQSLYNHASELPTDLSCIPVYATFYATPSVPDYCYVDASLLPTSNHSVLITVNPETTNTPPVIASWRPGASVLGRLIQDDTLFAAKIVMPAIGTYFAVDTLTGNVIKAFNNDSKAELYMNPTWSMAHPASTFFLSNVPKAGLIYSGGPNGVVGPDVSYVSDSEKASALSEWESLALPHFTVTLQSGNCHVNGLDSPLIISHDGPLAEVQLGTNLASAFQNLAGWKKIQFDASTDVFLIAKGIYAHPFKGLDVECDTFQEIVEDVLATFVGQNGYSPFQNAGGLNERSLPGFKVHSDQSGATRVIYLGLNVHSHLDPSGDISRAPALVGSLNSLPSTARAVREYIVGEDERVLGTGFDRCFEKVCLGSTCHKFANFAQQEKVEEKLDVCSRCAALNLDGVPKATIPWVDEGGQLTKAACDDYVVYERVNRRELSWTDFANWVYSEETFGPWSKPIRSFKPDEMPNYDQFDYNSPHGWGGTCSVGCGPVAWATLMAWGERTWGKTFGFIKPEHGEDTTTILCNDIHVDALYPFEGESDRPWPWFCRGDHMSYGTDCSDPLKSYDNPALMDCNEAGDIVNDRIVQLNEAMGTWCLGSGGATLPAQMDNANDLYGSWHVPFHTQELTTRHNSLMWLLGGLKNHYVRSQIRNGRPGILGFRVSFWGQHYAVAQSYSWRTRTRCVFGYCADRYDFMYEMNMGWGGQDNGWFKLSAWLAAWIDAKDDERSEEVYIAWLMCCEWDILDDDACSIDCANYSPPIY